MKVNSRNSTAKGMIFKPIPIGGKNNVAYLASDAQTGDAVVVDAGYKPKLILDQLEQHDCQLKYILATHAHRDHIGAAQALKEATGSQVAAYKTVPNIDLPLESGTVLKVGSIRVEVLHTPGHTPECLCFLINGEKLLTGDTMYVGKIPGAGHCNKREAQAFYDSIRRLMQLDDSVEVWPGHDVGESSSSTIGRERYENSCVAMNFPEFWKGRTFDKALDKWVPDTAAVRSRDQ